MNQLTQEQIEEVKKCKDNPVYFINHYIKHYHFKDGLREFKLYEPQEKLIHKYHKNRFNIVKAPRQIAGKSLTAIYYILHHILFKDEREVAMASHHINPATHLLDRFKEAYENLPKWLQLGVRVWNKTTVEFDNGSRVIATSVSPSRFRGTTFSLILLDELGNSTYNKVNEFFNVVFPIITVNNSSKMIITSTKDYYENGYFHKLWEDSENGKNDFVRTEIKWYEIPGKDKNWKREMIATLGQDVWNQQFECDLKDNQ
jgi:hypothetical protein